MTEFEYFSAMIAVILALGVTHILGQISLIAQRPKLVTLYWVHALWVVVVLLAHFSAWWNIWELKESISFSFPTFLYMLIGPTTLFLAARAIMPRFRRSDLIDWQEHYFSVHRVFFVLMAAFVIWPSLLGLYIPGTTSIMGVLEHSAFLVPIVACAISRSRHLHAIVAVLIAGAFLAVSATGATQ